MRACWTHPHDGLSAREVRWEPARASAISSSLPARSSALIRASSRRALARLLICATNTSSAGRRLAVYLLAFPAACAASRRPTSVLQPVYNDPSAQRNTYTQAPAITFDTPLG